MKTFLKAIVLVPVAVLAIAFAVANRQVVTVSFDPFTAGTPIFVLPAPLYLLVFLFLSCGVVIGGVASWLGQGRYRSAARRNGAEARAARAENGRLRTELDIQSRQGREAARLAGASSGAPLALEAHR